MFEYYKVTYMEDTSVPELVHFDALSMLEMADEQLSLSDSHSELAESELKQYSAHSPKLSVSTLESTLQGPHYKAGSLGPSRRSGFDYTSVIRAELQRLEAENLDPQTRRRLIQKIRNRVSAQRSRVRSKAAMSQLQEENTALRLENSQVLQRLSVLREEVALLRRQLREGGRARRFCSTHEHADQKVLSLAAGRRVSHPVQARLGETQALFKSGEDCGLADETASQLSELCVDPGQSAGCGERMFMFSKSALECLNTNVQLLTGGPGKGWANN